MFGFGRPRSRGYGGSLFEQDPYGDGYGAPRYGLSPRQELEMRRQQQAQMALRRKAAQQQQAERRYKAERQQQDRQQAMRRYTAAATVIQRAFRAHLARRRHEEQKDASYVITDAVRAVAARNRASHLVTSLHALHKTRGSIRQLCAAFEASPRGYRRLLEFVDNLERLTFALDAVPTHRSLFVRTFRKAIVSEAQEGLHFADIVCGTMGRSAAIMQRAVRAHQATKYTTERDAAARVITRAVRAAPVVRKARGEADVISQLRLKRRRLTQLREEYTHQLEAIGLHLDGLVADTETAMWLRRVARKETTAALEAVGARN